MGAVRMGFHIHEKLEVISWIQEHGGGVPSRAAVHFKAKGWKVDARLCRCWWSQRFELKKADGTAFRVGGGGRKPILGGYENDLLDLGVCERRRSRVSGLLRLTSEWASLISLRLKAG